VTTASPFALAFSEERRTMATSSTVALEGKIRRCLPTARLFVFLASPGKTLAGKAADLAFWWSPFAHPGWESLARAAPAGTACLSVR